MKFKFLMVALVMVLFSSVGFAASLGDVITEPENGEVLVESPPYIGLVFDEEFFVFEFEIANSDGEKMVFEKIFDYGYEQAFAVEPDTLPSGTYIVSWKARTEHRSRNEGEISFTIK